MGADTLFGNGEKACAPDNARIARISAGPVPPIDDCISAFLEGKDETMGDVRKEWLSALLKIAEPVLFALERGELHEKMPVACSGAPEERAKFTHLEAFGRLLLGLGAWLACEECDPEEEALRRKTAARVRVCIKNAVTPASPDFMNFSDGAQPLVDTAFLAQGILRAPKELYDALDGETKQNLLQAMRASRQIKPYRNNWLLFGAMPEVLLWYAGAADFDKMRIDYAVSAHENYYKGDGWYGDGAYFHFDYYNSFVIQPMLVDILSFVGDLDPDWSAQRASALSHIRQYALHLEHLISPEGTYLLIGRSLCYRFGAFQALALVAAKYALPAPLTPASVRSALTAVMRRTLAFPSMFDEKGWLRIGVLGAQPSMGENYISTGSLYLCSALFLPLSLPASAPFWKDPDAPWTSVRLWNGEDGKAPHAQDT